MARPLQIRKPTLLQLRRLAQLLESAPATWQRRRAEVLLLYAAGYEATSIAHALQTHPNTVYADLHAFEQQGLRSVRQRPQSGAVARITPVQRNEILRLAETAPTELGLPWGRWSLAKLRDYLRHQKLVPAISREHLRRILKKGACPCAGSGANSSVPTRSGRPF
jgi:transposase